MAADPGLYGHPFRGIWQQLAGSLGITTGRMQQNALDLQAEQEAQLRDANIALADAMQGGDEEQNAVAAQMMRDRAQLAAQNIAAIQRGEAPQPLKTGAELVAPFYQEREQGRIAAETHAEDQARELMIKRRDELHGEITKTMDFRDSKFADIDGLIDLTNKLGSNNDVVQSKARDLAGMSLGDTKDGEEYGSVGVHGLGHFDLASLLGITKQEKLSYDTIIKLAASARGIVDKYAGAKITALQQHAVASGFSIDPKTGGIADLNIPQYPTAPTAPRAYNPAVDALTGPPSLPQALGNTTLGSVLTKPAQWAGSLVGNLMYGDPGHRLGRSELDQDVAQRLSELTPEQRSALQVLQEQQARRRQRERKQRAVNP